ncbi:hypothetical protein MIND_01228000 [Mycena indigotica]|uniref:DUF6534 domain-containing protein n=1 Tax=Mycena indigotica TaxID=2126181 RepID=A0A8H6VS64_9AGAR|nr:uncharacterized protein MIND_01228000 [Mycena indigotica]KAF7292022.1 hypothetical protein MIND_01228000 [Mycena indigotica]
MSGSSDNYMASSGTTDFGRLLSSQLIGVLIDFLLMGALFLQMIVYRICFPKDALAFKLLVSGLLLLMLSRLFLLVYETQYFFAEGFGDGMRLAGQSRRQYSYALAPITLCIVQHFFDSRIFSLDRRLWPVCLLISFLSLSQCGVGCAAFGIVYVGSPASLLSKLALVTDLVRMWYILGMATALISTVTTVFVLLRMRAGNFNRSTKQALASVVRFTVESNAASAVVEIVSLALLQAYPNTTYYLGSTLLLPSVYTNMLLATLNYRAVVRQQRTAGSATAMTVMASQQSVAPAHVMDLPAVAKVSSRDSVAGADRRTSGSSGVADLGSVQQSQERLVVKRTGAA